MYGRAVRNLVVSATNLVAKKRCTIFPHPDLLRTFPLKSYRGRGSEGYVDMANSRETDVLRFHWITSAIRDRIFDNCTRGNRSASRLFAR
jgi:hypothetical protein